MNVASREAWLTARQELLDSPCNLAGLFSGCSQLLVYHFMFAAGWSAGCPICSFWTDTLSGASSHLRQRDTAMVWVSRARLAELPAYRQRMGWQVEWVSSSDSDFNFDVGVSFTPDQQEQGATYNFSPIAHPGDELPGLSAFALRDGAVYHTYSCYGRGLDALNPAYALLDRTAKGRDEAQLPSPMSWVRRRDASSKEA